MFNLENIDTYFPMPSYRDGQKETIEFALNSFNDGKRIIIIEAPTGSGKSAIAMTLANMVNKSYYLTVTKQLQDQLVRDFPKVAELKGKNAYPCTFYERFKSRLAGILSPTERNEVYSRQPDCSNGYCRRHDTKPCTPCFSRNIDSSTAKSVPPWVGDLTVLPPGMTYSACEYYDKVYTAINTRQVVMNFSSFLYQSTMTDRFGPRDMLLVDEGHSIESELLDFVSLSFGDSQLQRYGIFIPNFDNAYEYKNWFQDVDLKGVIERAIGDAEQSKNTVLEDDMRRLKDKYVRFVTSIDNSEWISEYKDNRSQRTITIKPVFAKDFANSLLFQYAPLVVILSATILDVGLVCRSLGIDRNIVAAYRMKNRFPVKNRPIYIKPAAKMTGGKGQMGVWGPKLVKSVNELVRKYPDQRGIIHTHNFAIADLLISDCDDDVKCRFLFQKDFRNKTELLAKHAVSKDTMIVAPAMHEGIDLADDLSRLQIIAKCPFPNYFDDPQLARRMELDPTYYTWIVALKLVQSSGRSVRSETDWADTYIIDESIYKFLKDAKNILPSWFTEAIIDV